MEIEEKSFDSMPPIFNDSYLGESLNNSQKSLDKFSFSVHNNSHNSKIINESTGNSSNDGIISLEKEKEQKDNISTTKYFQGNKSIFYPEKKKKIFRCQKKKKCRFRSDNLRTKFVRQLLNGHLNQKVLKYRYYIKGKNKKLKLKAFPENFIANIALVKNKYYLNKKLISLYEESKSKKYEQAKNLKKPGTRSKNKNVITLDEIKDKPGIKELLEKTLREFAYDYLIKFKKNIEKLNGKERKEKSDMFKYLGKYFTVKAILFNTLE